MLATPKQLAQGQLGSSSATLYTAPSATGQKCIVKEIWLCNTDSSDHTYTLYAVPSGGAAAAATQIANAVNLPAGYTHVLQIAHVIEASGTLRGLSSVASFITYTISGIEIS
jgi:hypothetical protein